MKHSYNAARGLASQMHVLELCTAARVSLRRLKTNTDGAGRP